PNCCMAVLVTTVLHGRDCYAQRFGQLIGGRWHYQYLRLPSALNGISSPNESPPLGSAPPWSGCGQFGTGARRGAAGCESRLSPSAFHAFTAAYHLPPRDSFTSTFTHSSPT